MCCSTLRAVCSNSWNVQGLFVLLNVSVLSLPEKTFAETKTRNNKGALCPSWPKQKLHPVSYLGKAGGALVLQRNKQPV